MSFELTSFNNPFIRVALVDDHKGVAEGFERFINESENARVVGKAYSAAGCIKLLEKAHCDVLFLDIGLPDVNGTDLCRQIKEKYPHIKVLMLTSYGELFTVNRAMDAGADGYLLKSCSQEELHKSIDTVASGGRYLCDEVNVTITKLERSQLKLSRIEMELLRLIAESYSLSEQADKMCLSTNTIRNYRQKLMIKLDVHTTSQLVQKAKKLKLV
jgi:Response regulator containing a CheY-like receiver domain and an HTH DNA-binding domain